MNGEKLSFCIQCKCGHENKLKNLIMELVPGTFVTPVMQQQHRSQNGVKSLINKLMLPGYLFLYSDEPPPFDRILRIEQIYRFLRYDGSYSFLLSGDDKSFANWLYNHDGLLGVSKAISVGDETRIIEGPLKDHVGTVHKIDRHNRNICLSITFDSATRLVWLPFVWTRASQEFGMGEN